MNEDADVLVEWWLDESALPDLHWARLMIFADGKAEVLDLDGSLHAFSSIQDARDWLKEDEYHPYSEMLAERQIDDQVSPPPSFGSKETLQPLMKKLSD